MNIRHHARDRTRLEHRRPEVDGYHRISLPSASS
jgi:hypothetical protein